MDKITNINHVYTINKYTCHRYIIINNIKINKYIYYYYYIIK